jgi:hypothetical protein
MNTPDAKTAANTMAPAPATMSVQQLIESMKPETPMVVDAGTSTFGGASAGTTGTANTPAPVTVTTSAPQ